MAHKIALKENPEDRKGEYVVVVVVKLAKGEPGNHESDESARGREEVRKWSPRKVELEEAPISVWGPAGAQRSCDVTIWATEQQSKAENG